MVCTCRRIYGDFESEGKGKKQTTSGCPADDDTCFQRAGIQAGIPDCGDIDLDALDDLED